MRTVLQMALDATVDAWVVVRQQGDRLVAALDRAYRRRYGSEWPGPRRGNNL